MNTTWDCAQSESGEWTAIPRLTEHPTTRERIKAAQDMLDWAGWDGTLRELARAIKPIRLNHTTGQAALDKSEGTWDEYFERATDGTLLAWELQV